MIVAKPWITAPITAASPTGPPPKIAILDPAGQASEFITPPAPVWKPQPSGPSSSSATSDVSTFTTLRARVTVSVEKEDWPKKCEVRSEEHTSELQSLMRISYAVFCLKNTQE